MNSHELEQLERDLRRITFPSEVRLDSGSVVVDPVKMIESHLPMVKAHPGIRAYKPYLDRLVKLKNICSK